MAFRKHLFKCKSHTLLSKYKEFYKKRSPSKLTPMSELPSCYGVVIKLFKIDYWGGGGCWKRGDVTRTNCIELTSISRQLHYLYCAGQDCFQLCVQFSRSSLKSFLPKLICLRLNLLLSPVTVSPR